MSEIQECRRCVLNQTVGEIDFDASGLCNYCRRHDLIMSQPEFQDPLRKKTLEKIISEIKHVGRNSQYDSLIGLSGGVDSSYLAWIVKQLGLRPLAVHFDNCWNSELAVSNIKNIAQKLNLDLHTYVIPWEEFKDLQRAYLKASVIDIEVPTDQLIFATLYKIAAQKKIKYILSGENFATESIMPSGWAHNSKNDLKNLQSIHKAYGKLKLKNFPKLGSWQRFYYDHALRIRMVKLLNYVSYIKTDAKELIKKELGWRDYGYKHFESIFTRFYQGYILPTKFNVDKRKAHFSNLICSDQMTKEEALRELQNPPYPVEQQMADKEYVIKKLDFSEPEFEAIMKLPIRPHAEFGTESDFPQRLYKQWLHFKSNFGFLERLRKKCL